MDDRKKLIARLLQETELAALAQEMGDEKQGQEVAEKVFDKFLEELDLDTIG